jgi:hypothetical protein
VAARGAGAAKWVPRRRSLEDCAHWGCRTVAYKPILRMVTWDQLRSGSESMSIVGIVAARIVGGAAVATVAVGVVFVALMLVESLSRSPDEIAKD